MKRFEYLFGLLIFLLISCAPPNKDEFLTEFSDFVDELDRVDSRTTEVDWVKKDKTFDKYTIDMYSKFKSEMTIMDEVKFNANKVRYNIRRHKSGFLEELLKNEDLIKLKEELKQYIEKDMDEDIEKVVLEAEKVSEELGRSVEELVEELKRELNRTE